MFETMHLDKFFMIMTVSKNNKCNIEVLRVSSNTDYVR